MDNNQNFIKFLGTGGARFVMANQVRSSAGTYINMKGQRIVLDPGPGTLVRCAKSHPQIPVNKLDGIILTHAHIDHSTDVNVLLDAMTKGGFGPKRGTLFAPRDALEGENRVVLRYLRDYLENIVILEPEQEYKLGDVEFSTSIPHDHGDETYGIKFKLDDKKISFLVDTLYFPELLDSYRGSDILILNAVRFKPLEGVRIQHLCFEDVRHIVSELKPQKAVLTHFGMTMLRKKPDKLAKRLTDELGIEVISAKDGMTLKLD